MPKAPLENIEFERMTLAVPKSTRTPLAVLNAMILDTPSPPTPIKLPDELEMLTPLAPLPIAAVPVESVPMELSMT
jgi:hypothetical protein